ncbi:MAG: HAMP domain-containing histidine kinase [Deltaproteobacteria bacterium]|nr:HAMP domain-containing histidine kinase [Deltaproteobacteria bacterium]
MAGRARQGTSFGQRIAAGMVVAIAVTLLIASSLYTRTGRGAADVELARLAYTQAVRVSAELDRTLTAQGMPTPATQGYLHRASLDLDVSLVLILEDDAPLGVAHGPSLSRALKRLKNADAPGRFTDSGQTPWVPTFGDAADPDRYPRIRGRAVRVQLDWPYAVEVPAGKNITLRLIPLSLLPLRDGGYRSALFVLFIVMALFSLLIALRLARPLEDAAIAMERMASSGGTWNQSSSSIKEIGWIARAATRLRQRAVDAENQQRAVLRSLGQILVEPIGRVKENLASISGGRMSAARREALGDAERDVGNLHRTVSALWQWNSLEAGSLQANLDDTEVRRLVRDVVRLFVERRAPGLDVDIQFHEDVDETLRLDSRLLAGVFAALLDNVRVHGSGPVTIHASRAHTKVEIRIRDAGPGVPFEEVGNLFQPFRRLGGADSEGLGLGMRVARLVLALHEGGLSARNHPEGGFEVTLWLPAPPIRVSTVDRSLQSYGWAQNTGDQVAQGPAATEEAQDSPPENPTDPAAAPVEEPTTIPEEDPDTDPPDFEP